MGEKNQGFAQIFYCICPKQKPELISYHHHPLVNISSGKIKRRHSPRQCRRRWLSLCVKLEAALVCWLFMLWITPCGLRCWCWRTGRAAPRRTPSVRRPPAGVRSSSPCRRLCTSGSLRRSLPRAQSPRLRPAGKRTPRSLSHRLHAGVGLPAHRRHHPPPPPPARPPTEERLHFPLPGNVVGQAVTLPPRLMCSPTADSALLVRRQITFVAQGQKLAGLFVESSLELTQEGFQSTGEGGSEGAPRPLRSQEACSHSKTLRIIQQ